VGERGAAYNNVCPEEMREPFYAAYQEGRRIYLAQSEINNLNRTIAQKETRLKEIKDEMAAIAGYIIDVESTPGERAEMLLESKNLAEEQGKLENEIQDLRMNVAVKTERLENLRHSLALNTFQTGTF
jgi:chromosome segregation ATPase